FFIISSIAVQTPDSGISNLLAVGTTFTGSGNLYCQWELSPGSGNAMCILFPTVSYHKLFDILKQYQNEVNELRAERLSRNANPLALVATAQANLDPYYQTSRSHKSYAPSSKPSILTRSHTSTRHKGKEIAKPITPPSETAYEEDSDPEQAQRDKDMQKNLALIAKYFKKIYKPINNNLRTSKTPRTRTASTARNLDILPRNAESRKGLKTPHTDEEVDEQELEAHYSYMAKIQEVHTAHSGTDSEPVEQRMVNVAGARENVGSPVVQQSGIRCFNCKKFRHFAKECSKPKRELEAHYSYMARIQEVPTTDTGADSKLLEQVQNDVGYNVFVNKLQHSEESESISNTCLVETDDSSVILDLPDMCVDDI
nr:hypothetical protein [Tanacetum cinerariifolium]